MSIRTRLANWFGKRETPRLLLKDSTEQEQIELCSEWFALHAKPRKTTNWKLSSSDLAYKVENWSKCYTSEEYLIRAAILQGYTTKYKIGPHPYFNITLLRRGKKDVTNTGD